MTGQYFCEPFKSLAMSSVLRERISFFYVVVVVKVVIEEDGERKIYNELK